MILAIISDSHDNIYAIEKFLNEIKNKDIYALIHAGDIVAPFSLKMFEKIPCKKFFVFGNNDGERKVLGELSKKYGIEMDDFLEIELNNKKIAIYHGTIKGFLESIIKSNIYDIVIYGHTHKTDIRNEGKTLVINPGELCGYLTGKRTYMLMNLKEMKVETFEI